MKDDILFDIRYYPIRLKNQSKVKFGMWFANMLPKYLVSWCGIRIAASLDDCDTPLMTAIGSWENG